MSEDTQEPTPENIPADPQDLGPEAVEPAETVKETETVEGGPETTE